MRHSAWRQLPIAATPPADHWDVLEPVTAQRVKVKGVGHEVVPGLCGHDMNEGTRAFRDRHMVKDNG